MPVTVLHLLKTSVGATWALRQIRELVRLGVLVHVALPPEGPLAEAYGAVGAKVHFAQFDFPTACPWLLPSRLRQLRALVGEVKPDVIHSHFVGTTLTMRLALRGVRSPRRVFQVPGPLHMEHALFRTAELLTATPADSWIGSCAWTRERYIRAGVPPERVFLSYYGTDVEAFVPGARGTLREELGWDPSRPLVGMVSYMYAPKRYLLQRRGVKGHEDLIDATRILLARGVQVRTVFVGGAWDQATWYEEALRAYAAANCGDNAVFLGTRRDVASLYSNFSVAVHPSLSENVGGAVESLLLEVPTIATRVGGFPDLVRHGDTGWLVPPASPCPLADAIEKALRSPEDSQRLASRGRALALRLFDVRRTSREILDIYETLLARS